MNHHLLCCDWGTSSLRLRLVDDSNYNVIAEFKSDEGISVVFRQWKDENLPEKDRIGFYLQKLKHEIKELVKISPVPFKDAPVVISGMASSTIGIIEIPYADLPFSINADGISKIHFNDRDDFRHDVTIVSGIRSDKDVMRGEETQIIGLFHLSDIRLPNSSEGVFVFPGTHSKHIYVKNKEITDFRTFMTGEVFSLLSEQSILKDSVSKTAPETLANSGNKEAFEQGVEIAGSFPVLHSLFTVRTNQLFNKLAKEQNFFYLSGLLIGAELRDLLQEKSPIVICCGNNLYTQYKLASKLIGLDATFIEPALIDKATIAGQVRIYKGNQ